MRRFLSALVLAPLAGGATAFLVAMIAVLIAERNVGDAAHLGTVLGFWALLICLAYVIVIGSAAYAWSRMRGRPLSLAAALITGIVAGVVPFVVIALRKETAFSMDALLFPGLALICSLATAWTFWRVAFAGANA